MEKLINIKSNKHIIMGMFKKTTLFFLFLASITIFIITSAYFIITKTDQSGSQYYGVENKPINKITTIIQKENWEAIRTANILAKNKVKGNFISRNYNLGIVAVSFDTHNKSINDKIIFRLKEAGKKDWYYQGTYNASQFQNNIPFPFGFPLIANSRNISYVFEIESLDGTPNDSISISNINSHFFSKYKFSKSELSKDPSLLSNFIVAKVNEQLSLLKFWEITMILLLSVFPLFILLILRETRQKTKGTNIMFSKLFKTDVKDLFRTERNKINEDDGKDVLFGFMVTFSIIAFTVLLAGMWSSPLTAQRKWVPYLSILIPSIILGLNYLKGEWLNKGYFLIISSFLSSAISTLVILNYGASPWLNISGVLLLICLLAIIRLMKYFSFIFLATFIFLFDINSLIFISKDGWLGSIWTAFIISIIIPVFLFSLFYRSNFVGWIKINKIIFAAVLIISVIFSLRSDSIFLGSAEFHWSYYTGVIQTIRSGGELLWSAPSQYGLLNVLLPSLLPWTSRNSFFIFQAILFFASIFIIIKTIYICFKRSAAFIFIALTSLSLFYFADPELIGPTLYPSSSALRFFMVYILLYTILSEYHKHRILDGRNKWLVTGVYIFGALWSAESALYATIIYTVYLFSSAISIYKSKANSVFKFIFKNTLTIIISFIAFNIFYFAITHHFPDWSMYFMYAFNYANGFGELPIPPWGIHWAVIITFSCLVFILWRLYSSRRYEEWIIVSVCLASLWGLSSYYVGRAIQNNLTALLPEIFYIFLIMSSALINSQLIKYRLLLNAVFLPWIILGIIGGFGNPQFIEKLRQFKYAEDVNSKSFKPDRELDGILDALGASRGARILYYGNPYNNPVITGENGKYIDMLAGMPMPLTLLEKPIPNEKSEIIMRRFMNNIKEPVFFIYRKDEGLTRIDSWKNLFEREYSIEKKEFGNKIYEVFIIRRK